MTIANSANRSGPYDGNGSTTVFDRTFKILDADHLKVYQTILGVTTEVTTGITKNDNDQPTGTVTFSVAPLSGTQITLIREVPLEQSSDYSNQGKVEPETVEDDLDKAMMIMQDLSEKIDRSYKAPLASAIFTDGNLTMFDATGAVVDSGVSPASISASVASAASSAAAAAASAAAALVSEAAAAASETAAGASATAAAASAATASTAGADAATALMVSWKAPLFIARKSASSSSELVFTEFDSGAFIDYIFRIRYMKPVTDGSELRAEFSIDGGSNYFDAGTDYGRNLITANSSSTTERDYANDSAYLGISGGISNAANDPGVCGEFYVYDPAAAFFTSVKSEVITRNAGGAPRTHQGGSYLRDTGVVNAVRFFMNSGSILIGDIDMIGIPR